MDLGLSGLSSGFDWRSFIDQLIQVERAPQDRLRVEQSGVQKAKTAYQAVQNALGTLKSRTEALGKASLYQSRSASSSDTTLMTASAASGTAAGSYAINVSQMATAAKLRSAASLSAPLHADDDVSDLTLSDAPLATAITAGTFTVNGKSVTVATTDTLQQVFERISTATGGQVTASYNHLTDRIQLASAAEIRLGSAADSSNFLQAARLFNNGANSVSSSADLGVVLAGNKLTLANFATTPNDGGAGAGKFKVNGVEITWNAGTDSLKNILDRINSSGAGVTASYDVSADKVVLVNNVTGDIGVSVEDVTGNFTQFTGLAAGTIERGLNLRFTVNGGSTLQSHSNLITGSSSGIDGLSVTVLKQGAATVTVGSDREAVKTALKAFVTQYNQVQSLVDSYTASSTDAQGKVTAGVLADDNDASTIASALRSRATGDTSGLTGVIHRLDDLGITTSGYDNALSISDEEALDAALEDHLSEVQAFFTADTTGLANRLTSYLETVIGDEGSLVTKQELMSDQISSFDTQIADMDRYLQSERQRLIDSFVAMEVAQSRMNQQLQFLQQRFGNTSS